MLIKSKFNPGSHFLDYFQFCTHIFQALNDHHISLNVAILNAFLQKLATLHLTWKTSQNGKNSSY